MFQFGLKETLFWSFSLLQQATVHRTLFPTILCLFRFQLVRSSKMADRRRRRRRASQDSEDESGSGSGSDSGRSGSPASKARGREVVPEVPAEVRQEAKSEESECVSSRAANRASRGPGGARRGGGPSCPTEPGSGQTGEIRSFRVENI